MRVFFSVGEPSGDLHGANLIRALRQLDPTVECVGYGGPRMAEAGCDVQVDLTQLAVMWVSRVLAHLRTFLDLLKQADQYFRDHRPDAVVLVDYPGFNWWIARRAKAQGIPVFYYSPPQLWAWASWRIKKMRRFVDHILCGLPFEVDWYRERNCHATFVGHPYFDELRERQLDTAFVAQQRQQPGKQVTILPGSRTQEVTHNLPTMLQAAWLIHQQCPDVRFTIAAFREHQAEYARQLVRESQLPIEVFTKRTAELIETADCCLAVSGSVSLELLYHAKPTVIVYQCSRFGYFVQSRLRCAKYITLGNLMSDPQPFVHRATHAITAAARDENVLFPEYLGCDDHSADMAAQLVRWLQHDSLYQARVARLVELRDRVGHGGASIAAARYLTDVVQGRRPSVPQPHFFSEPLPKPVPLAVPGSSA